MLEKSLRGCLVLRTVDFHENIPHGRIYVVPKLAHEQIPWDTVYLMRHAVSKMMERALRAERLAVEAARRAILLALGLRHDEPNAVPHQRIEVLFYRFQ